MLCNARKKNPGHLSWKRRGLPRCFWIRTLSTQQGGYVHATNLLYYYYYYCILFILLFDASFLGKKNKTSICCLCRCSGLLMASLGGMSFWEQTSDVEFKPHLLNVDGICTSLSFNSKSRHCLASFRPNKNYSRTRHVVSRRRPLPAPTTRGHWVKPSTGRYRLVS